MRTEWTWGDPPIDHCEVRGDEIVAWTDDSQGGIGTGCTLEEFASGRMNTVSLPSNVRREVTALVAKLLTVPKGQRAARLFSAQKLFAQQERASKRTDAAVPSPPPAPRAVLSREQLSVAARVALRAGDWRAVIQSTEIILGQTPKDTEALLAHGIAKGATGDLAAAREALTSVLEIDPRQHDAWYSLGMVHLRQGRFERAVACYRAALRIDPDNHPSFFQCGAALEAADRGEEALAAYREAVRTSPNPGRHWGYRGMDFTKEAEAAIARLSSTNRHGKGLPP